MRKPVIAITLGDVNGIGPEVTLKSIAQPAIRKICWPVLVGPLHAFEHYARLFRLRLTFREISSLPASIPAGAIPVVEPEPFASPQILPGKLSRIAGRHAGEAIRKAAALCLSGEADGMVTAPVSKEAMASGGYRYAGQTEMLSAQCEADRVMMMLVAGAFRVGLATVHLPLKSVADAITRKTLSAKLSLLHRSLRGDFGIQEPRIAVLGLNPHAGEHGLIGSEERSRIAPANRSARKRGMLVDGPFPADGFLGTRSHRSYDAVLAMYHDQGLIPLKMEGFDIGVNFSAGLPIVRTSPDHGTAFGIAGEGIADPGSMREAIKLAVAVVGERRRRNPFRRKGSRRW